MGFLIVGTVGGFVISRGPISQLVPVENAAMAERTVIQWDKEDIETFELVSPSGKVHRYD